MNKKPEAKSLKITLVGYGKMGHAIELEAVKCGHSIASRISRTDPDAHFQSIFEPSVKDADICIDFTHSSVFIDNLTQLAKLGKSVIVGTTGWHDQLDQAKEIVETHNIGLLWAENFSFGVNLFYEFVKNAANIVNNFSQYDVSGLEIHHKDKEDAPSGTGAAIANILIDRLDTKTHPLFETPKNRKLKPSELHFASLRCGANPGKHQVIFDSEEDTITLTHQACSRKGFAEGAIKAAEWLDGKKGIYKIEDMMSSILNGGDNS